MEKMDPSQRTTLLVVIVTSFMTTFIGSALNLSVPAIGHEFKASAVLIGWVITSYILSAAALSVPFGRLSDIIGRKYILVIGILIFAICSGLSAVSWSIVSLIFFRVLQGIGAAMIFSTNTAVLISAFPPTRRGIVLGYAISSTYIGLTAGPVLGGILNHYFGWRSIFIATFVLGLFIALLAFRKLESKEPIVLGEKMDALGNILYIAMIFSIMYGLSVFSSFYFARFLIPFGILLFVIFIRHELRVLHPIIEVRLFHNNTAYLLSNLAALLNYGATFALGYLLSIYLQLILKFDSQISGMILISQPLLMAFLSPYAGRLSDRISSYKLASFGMALSAAGILSFAFISLTYPVWLIIVNLIIIGIGFAFFSSPNTNAVMSCVEKKDYGVASSILATMRTLGHSGSMVIVTLIMSSHLGTVSFAAAEPEALVQAMRLSFIFFSMICIVGVFISLRRKK
jgi:EmrB/QacA subfamily drug resistance transporter